MPATTLHINTSSAASRPKNAVLVSPVIASAYKKKTMSITQTYFLAHKARGKLSAEAARPDHNLRLLVGHANLLDSLMLELADAEREQESWFNQSVRGATKHEEKERHIQWADNIVEEPEEDWQAEDAESDSSSDSDSDFDEEDVEMTDAVALRRVPSHQIVPTLRREAQFEEDDMEEDDEDYAELSLTRSPSHSASPPELEDDLDSSDDESMPPSPPTVVLPTFTEKQKESIATSAYYDSRTDDKDAFYDEGFYLPPRGTPRGLVSAISVY